MQVKGLSLEGHKTQGERIEASMQQLEALRDVVSDAYGKSKSIVRKCVRALMLLDEIRSDMEGFCYAEHRHKATREVYYPDGQENILEGAGESGAGENAAGEGDK